MERVWVLQRGREVFGPYPGSLADAVWQVFPETLASGSPYEPEWMQRNRVDLPVGWTATLITIWHPEDVLDVWDKAQEKWRVKVPVLR